jgi:glycine cleavage system regulatory protein
VNTYLSQLGTRMVNVNLKANIPEKLHLAFFKEQLMAFCDERNVDVFLDPVRLYA